LITPEGNVKITDFGIARVTNQVSLTQTGQVMGTVQYLAPEQATGKPATASGDIYSLGIVAYEALAGKRPFKGETQMAIAMAQINDTPPPLSADIDPKLVKLVMDCMAKKPDQRPHTALELAARAEALMTEGTSSITVISQQVSDETTTIDTDTKPITTVPPIWPWLALIVILLTTIAVVVWAGLIAPKQHVIPTKSPSQTPTQSPTDTGTPSPPPTETPTKVAILLSDFQGLDVSLVVPQLTALGLIVEPLAGDSVPADDPRIGLVYDVTPLGNLSVGSTIQVYYYQQVADQNTGN
jgi:serine/threonine-protein kinase